MEIMTRNGYTFQVDEQDYELASSRKWIGARFRERKKDGEWGKERKYIIRFIHENGKRKHQRLHRFLLDAPRGLEVDHKNGDTLDNRRCNIRLCTRAQNQMNKCKQLRNRSGYKGVCWYQWGNKWEANITIDCKTIVVGRFLTKEEAALAYNKAALEHFGEFARLNEIK